MPPTAKQRSDTQQFMQLTGASERIASRYLKAAGWKSDVAIDSYYSQGGSTGAPPKDTTAALTKIFEQYRNVDEDEKDTTGVNGTMSYLEAIGIDIESVDVLVPLEIVQAPVIGEMTKQGFVDGWKALGLDTVAKQKDHVNKLVKQLPHDPALFKRVYRYTWVCARESGAKALAVDAAIVYWEMLFSPGGQPWATASTNWLELWIEYLRAKWNKSVNKDMWNMTLEFANKSMKDETLSFWDENGAWPGVIDDFVVYAKQKRGSPETMEID